MAEARILLDASPRAQDHTPDDFASWEARGGAAAVRSLPEPGDVLTAVDRAGLRGRGGASFPAAVKWRMAAENAAQHPDGAVVVANGGEHEPGSRKDAWLVEHRPHAVLEGMLLCGLATGARTGWLYLIEDMAGPIAAAEKALEEMRSAGLVGPSALGGQGFEVEIFRAPTTYVAGEETAALDAIEGGPGKPRKKPPYPGESGLFGRPTTVNNVETLAHVPWIVRHGSGAYAAIGTDRSKGTMLFTLPDGVARPGIVEAPFGVTYRQLIEDHGGGTADGRAVRAVLPATSSAFLGADDLDAPICYDGLRERGTSPGCGGIHLVLEGDDPVAKILDIARFFMAEQCGQCAPCRMETNQIVHVLQAVAEKKGPGYAEKIRKVTDFARGKGYCSLIEMAAAPVLSGLRVFESEFAEAAGG